MNKITRNILTALLLIIAQTIIFNNINLFGYLNPFIYIIFIIYYPIKNDRIFFIFISFIIGLLIDIFSDTLGLHAAASVTIAYLRPLILKISFGLAYIHQVIKFKNIDFKNKLIYISLLSIIHHAVLFSLEIFDFSKLLFSIDKVIMSSFFTISLCFLFSYLFKTNER
ncbi:rod shape-determining protein MreD [Flavobacteriaceae bacterium]|nr:rod shape-determining protein MreD [Flavobacteriaceae bacterium]